MPIAIGSQTIGGSGGGTGGVADGTVTTAKLAANAVTLAKIDAASVTAAALGAAQAPGSISASYDLTVGGVVDYTADAQWAPTGVSLNRNDTGLLTRNGWRFWGRGTAKGSLQGTATGLRLVATSATDGNQSYPSNDAGFSLFAEMPGCLELEVDCVVNFSLPAKATGGWFAARAGLMTNGLVALQHLAWFSVNTTNSGNWTREHGYGSGTTGTATQITTSLTMSRAFRVRWRGGIQENWEGAALASLSRLSATVPGTLSQAFQPRIFTLGISNSQGVGLSGAYAEITTLAWRDRWSA